MKKDSGFRRHRVLVRVEGFELQRLLSQCLKSGIHLKRVKIESDMSMRAELLDQDKSRFLRLAKNRYRITVLGEKGYKPLFLRVIQKKSTIVGMLVFVFVLWYQSAFISEIQIYGYEKTEEQAVRAALKEAGLYEGGLKVKNLEQAERELYSKLDNISWIGIEYQGSMALVNLVEGGVAAEPVDRTQPCNIVARKDGYLEQILAKEGDVVKEPGSFVRAGEVVISGVVPITEKSYSERSEEELVRYIHAEGEVKARIIYRLKYYQETHAVEKQPTGRSWYGFNLQLGQFSFNSAKTFWMFDASTYEEKNVLESLKVIPFRFSLIKVSEVELFRHERTEAEVQRLAGAQSRDAIKEFLPENTQILNNSLMFEPKENIIEVTIMLHALEEIGEQQPFDMVWQSDPSDEGSEGGTESIGEPTD